MSGETESKTAPFKKQKTKHIICWSKMDGFYKARSTFIVVCIQNHQKLFCKSHFNTNHFPLLKRIHNNDKHFWSLCPRIILRKSSNETTSFSHCFYLIISKSLSSSYRYLFLIDLYLDKIIYFSPLGKWPLLLLALIQTNFVFPSLLCVNQGGSKLPSLLVEKTLLSHREPWRRHSHPNLLLLAENPLPLTSCKQQEKVV